MSKKFGIYCEYCNVLLNNEDNIFGTNFGQLYHSNCMGGITHGKSTDCQPQMLFKMNLKFADAPTITTEAEREIMELKNSNNAARQYAQQLEAKIKTFEDALLVKTRLKDDVNKLMDCVVKLENTLSINVIGKSTDIVNNTSQDKSNKQAYDENNLIGDDSFSTGEAVEENIDCNNSNNGVLQSVQQLESRMKTLEDALLQTKSDGNKLTEGKTDYKAPDGDNNITQDPKVSKEKNYESNLTGEHRNDTENVASASGEHHTWLISKEKQEVVDLRNNCVLIQCPEGYSASLDEAFSYVHELAKKMNVQIAENSVLHIWSYCSNYYVYFRDAESKKEFLKNKRIFKYNPNTKDYLRILDYSNFGIVDIENFQSSDLSTLTAFVNVLGLATKMGLKNIEKFIDHIDVYSTGRNILTYSVTFNDEYVKKVFVEKNCFLKHFTDTKSIIIRNVGGHKSNYSNVNNFNMAAASSNVIGVAELMGLSLSIDNIKRIYVINGEDMFNHIASGAHLSFVVEFSSIDIKNIFVKNMSELTPRLDIDISDINTEGGNFVSIKYYKKSIHMFTAMSFIGLAKQLGFSITPAQTDHFFKLSEFISKASF